MNNKTNTQSITYSFILTENIWLKGSLLLIAFAIIHLSTLSSLSDIWWNRQDASHGFLVPFISLYFVWIKRKSLMAVPIQQGIAGGMAVLTAGAIFYAFGIAGGILLLQGISIIVMLSGLVLILLGRDYLKALSLPLLYLFFMLPLLDILSGQRIHWPFQLLSATMAAFMLKLFGIPVFQNIQYIEMPGISLEVARYCSGVSYLTSIFAIAVPLAYLTQREWRGRILLAASALIIGIMTNWLRIFFIAVWLYNGGESTHGPWHMFQGIFVSIVGFVLLFIAAIIFTKKPPYPIRKSCDETNTIKNPAGINIKRFNIAWLIAMLIISGLAANLYLYNPKPMPLKAPLKELSTSIGDWKGRDANDNEKFFRLKGVDSEIMRIYSHPSGREVALYIGYFEHQRQGKEIMQHNFNSLYYDSSKVGIPAGRNINKTIIREKEKNYMVIFWNDLNGQSASNVYKVLFTTAINSLIYRRSNGAVIVVSAILNHPDEHQRAFEESMVFVNELIPILHNYLPGKENL